jgi:hypothetical protein
MLRVSRLPIIELSSIISFIRLASGFIDLSVCCNKNLSIVIAVSTHSDNFEAAFPVLAIPIMVMSFSLHASFKALIADVLPVPASP